MSNDLDAIIIGSGAGGAAAAFRLAEAGRKILVFEKGPVLPADGSTQDARIVISEGRFSNRDAWVDRRGKPFVPRSFTISAAKRSGMAQHCCASRRTSLRTSPPISTGAGHLRMRSLSPITTRPKRCCSCAGSRSSPTPRASSPHLSGWPRPGARRQCLSASRRAFSTIPAKQPGSMASPPRMGSNPMPRLA